MSYSPDVYLPHPVVADHEKAPNIIVDIDGKEYIDFLSNDGASFLHDYNSPEEIEVLCGALRQNICVTNFINADAKGEWAESICALTGYDKAFPLCSGSEANDAAMKLMTKRHKRITGRNDGVILAMDGCYFGRTIGANSASAGAHSHYVDGVGGWNRVRNVSSENFLSVVAAFASAGQLAGVMFEVLPGRDLRRGFLGEVFLSVLGGLRAKYDFAVMVDEIKTGMGKMGTVLASQYMETHDCRPDIVTVAKPLAGGLPFAAVLATEKYWECIDHGWHSSTMGGNPALCKYSMYLMSKLTPAALTAVRDMGLHITATLTAHSIESVGKGLHQNIFMPPKVNAHTVRDMLIQKGWLVYQINNENLCIMPPLSTTWQQINDFLDDLIECVEEARL